MIASANANGGTSADARAVVVNGIVQHAFDTGSGNASGTITGSGTINVAAIANATATGNAFAAAGVFEGIDQSIIAYGSGNGNAVLDVGNINVVADAHATGKTAEAFASNISGIFEGAGAFGGGNASASFNNSGTVDIAAVGVAHASSGPAEESRFSSWESVRSLKASLAATLVQC